MLKLMRACIKIKKPEDLWIMKNKPERGSPSRKTEGSPRKNREALSSNALSTE